MGGDGGRPDMIGARQRVQRFNTEDSNAVFPPADIEATRLSSRLQSLTRDMHGDILILAAGRRCWHPHTPTSHINSTNKRDIGMRRLSRYVLRPLLQIWIICSNLVQQRDITRVVEQYRAIFNRN